VKYFLVLNDAPYGTERSCNALRLARSLLAKEKGEVRVLPAGRRGTKHGQKPNTREFPSPGGSRWRMTISRSDIVHGGGVP
jgi:sulfur relay (sulfurtransferase) complex TusBCD TusD component (DsrE family)